MPELPDLHVFKKNLKAKAAEKEIVAADVFNKMKVNETVENIKQIMVGTHVVDIVREGKELVFQLANGHSFSVHLMLNGKFQFCDYNSIFKVNSKIIAIGFDDGSALVVSDYQGLCKVTFDPVANGVPDALSEAFTNEYFHGVARRNGRKNIKAFLINQSIVKGIGNAYADEILWKANISPESVTGKVPEARLSDLYHAIHDVLLNAIENIERISPDIISGEVRSFLEVHNPRKKTTSQGDKIIVKQIATKTTYYTEKQELFI